MIISRRHKKDFYTARVIKNAAALPKQEWQKVYPDILEGYSFFKTLDESGIGPFSFRYILVYHRKTLVGIAPCFLLDYALDTSISGGLRRFSNRIKKYKPNIFNIKAVVCGLLTGEGKIGIKGDTDKIMNAITRKMEQIARKNRAPVIAFKDFGKSYEPLLDNLKKNGFIKLESLPMTVLNLRFANFEDYLKTLSSKSRYDMRRKIKKLDSLIKINYEVIDEPDENTYKEIYALYLQVVDRHEMGFEVLPIEFFKNLPKNMPGNVKYFLWRINGKLAAFDLSLVSDDTLIAYYVGLDYSIAYDYHLYFIKFHDMLNWCLDHNIKKFEFGYTGYEPKRRLGFDPVPVYLYAKLRNRIFRPVFNLVCNWLKFENFDPEIKKLKERRAKK